jgi:hypothetical protein
MIEEKKLINRGEKMRTKNSRYLYPNNLVRGIGFEPLEPTKAEITTNPKKLKISV